ncbi:uncharacterized protein LOC106672727 [Cimex lectularius]|uniref:Innexin n=1 Tax=Cimex lectularius TaxID=79782 RepID=A0A8I6SA74_CIMLE|nr:uncharacterized protein LOC106672727 [Cimex lectularius]
MSRTMTKRYRGFIDSLQTPVIKFLRGPMMIYLMFATLISMIFLCRPVKKCFGERNPNFKYDCFQDTVILNFINGSDIPSSYEDFERSKVMYQFSIYVFITHIFMNCVAIKFWESVVQKSVITVGFLIPTNLKKFTFKLNRRLPSSSRGLDSPQIQHTNGKFRVVKISNRDTKRYKRRIETILASKRFSNWAWSFMQCELLLLLFFLLRVYISNVFLDNRYLTLGLEFSSLKQEIKSLNYCQTSYELCNENEKVFACIMFMYYYYEILFAIMWYCDFIVLLTFVERLVVNIIYYLGHRSSFINKLILESTTGHRIDMSLSWLCSKSFTQWLILRRISEIVHPKLFLVIMKKCEMEHVCREESRVETHRGSKRFKTILEDAYLI